MIRPALSAVLALGLAAGVGAQDQGLVDRFGPDGLPFSHDDPLAVGGGASRVRYGAMAADACSEDVVHSHPTGSGVMIPAELSSHPKRDSLGAYGDPGSPNLILNQPFDFTLWVSAIELGEGRVARFRAFPEDEVGWGPLEYKADERGWVDRWTSHTDPDLGDLLDGDIDADSGAGDRDMENVWSPGPQVKNIHLETLGLSYRDVKPAGGFPIAIKQQTLETMTEFWDRMKNKVDELHMFSQQAYIEGWVTEIMNLETKATGISGNFVLDMTGLQIVQIMDYSKTKSGCTVSFDDVPLDLGGPVGAIPTPDDGSPRYEKVTTYFDEQRWDYVWSHHEKSGIACAIGSLFVDIEAKAKEKALEKLEPMDLAAELMDEEKLDEDDSETLYEIIARYSGLAGRGDKNVFDRFALSVMIFFAQFKPTEWTPWAYVDASEAMMGFDPPRTLTSTQEALEAEDGFRYNNGSSYIGKAMWIYGNSRGKDDNGIGTQTNDATHRLANTEPGHQLNLEATPDILYSFAMEWLYVRMDILDPYLLPDDFNGAAWSEQDILVPRSPVAPITVDWPPPNYGFGRAHVVGFRAASGGNPPGDMGPDRIANVDPATVAKWEGLVCIDPVTETYSLLGAMDNDPSDIDVFDLTAGYRAERYDTPSGVDPHSLTWSEPRALGPDGLTPGIPPDLDTGSDYRWLTAGANRWGEGQTELRWGWDFDTSDGGVDLDSTHAQHMSDVRGAEWGAVFAFQTNADGGFKGRTGFTLVDMVAPLEPPDRAAVLQR